MFSVRVKGADSWLDPESAGLLGWKLGNRLLARCNGREGRFITLTYRREPYLDAQDCFDRARSQKHVSRFMRKLGAAIGSDLKGKWICKMEFQQGGWVHWHILLLDVGKIPREIFEQIYAMWGRGGINIKPMTEENIKYLTKYISKDGNVPGWVYGYPPRSIKVVRPSAGFWKDDQAKKAREKTAKRKQQQEGKKPEGREQEYYVPIGEKIKREAATIRVGDKAFTVVCERWRLLRALRTHCEEPTLDGTWRKYESSSYVLSLVLADCEGTASTEAPPQRQSTAGQSKPKPWRPLFLRGTGKRVGWWKMLVDGEYLAVSPEDLNGVLSKWWAKNAPWWLQMSWEQEARYDYGMDMHGGWGWPPDAVTSAG